MAGEIDVGVGEYAQFHKLATHENSRRGFAALRRVQIWGNAVAHMQAYRDMGAPIVHGRDVVTVGGRGSRSDAFGGHRVEQLPTHGR